MSLRTMSSPEYIYPIIVPSDFDVEDAFSSTNTPNYTPASLDYFSASPRNTSSAPPQVFEIEENYHGVPDTSYARHEKHIETIFNHLDDILLSF
ncbi:hypothetical protein Tco_0033057 [Tanacetum coccineum]